MHDQVCEALACRIAEGMRKNECAEFLLTIACGVGEFFRHLSKQMHKMPLRPDPDLFNQPINISPRSLAGFEPSDSRFSVRELTLRVGERLADICHSRTINSRSTAGPRTAGIEACDSR